MALANPSVLLIGGLLVAIPIVLHMVMRQQPKHLVFPALRFLKERREVNRRKLRLRQWLLLLLRCAAIFILAAAMARPSVSSVMMGNWILVMTLGGALLVVVALVVVALTGRKGPAIVGSLAALAVALAIGLVVLLAGTLGGESHLLVGDQKAPVAAVLVVDTSPRMQFRRQNKTRLDEAQETALWLLKQLPRDSEVAVIDSRAATRLFAADVGAAKNAIQALQVTNVAVPLPRSLDEALGLIDTSDKQRKEVYVFTDMTRPAWSAEAGRVLQGRLKRMSEVPVYVVDVGVEDARNFSLGQLELSSQTLSAGSVLRLRTELSNIGPGGERVVELSLEEPDSQRPIIVEGRPTLPKFRPRDRRTLKLEPDSSQAISFQMSGLDVGIHHGRVRIVGEDGLAADDVRFFTVQVKDTWPLLVVAAETANASFFTEAIAPATFRRTGRASYQCDVVSPSELASRKLQDYAAVCLLDPGSLKAATWRKLADYARGGGGVAIFLGRNARPVDSFNEPAAQELLPGRLTVPWRSGDGDLYLAPGSLDHQIMAEFRPISAAVPWQNFPVYKHWGLAGLSSGASVIVSYSNNKPALIERVVGKGRVLTMTTPISDPNNVAGRPPWNVLPTGLESWPFFLLSNAMASYLVQGGDANLNYLTGQRAQLHDQAHTGPEHYALFNPRGDWQSVTATDGTVVVNFTETPGLYRLIAEGEAPVSRGFCVNLPADVGDLRRATTEQLDELLGADRYQLARNRDEIIRGMGQARGVREFYPFLLLMLTLVIGLEHILANRFYRPGEST